MRQNAETRKNTTRFIARLLVVCLLCVNCIGLTLLASAAEKVTTVLSPISDKAETLANVLEKDSGGLYLTNVYSIQDGKYMGIVRTCNDWGTYLAVSEDRVSWELLGRYNGFTYGNDLLLSWIGDTLAFSSDGQDWQYISFPDRKISNVRFDSGKFYMYISYEKDEVTYGSYMVSEDCQTWYDVANEWPEDVRMNSFRHLLDNENGVYYVFAQDSEGVVTGHYTAELTEGATEWTKVELPEGVKSYGNEGNYLWTIQYNDPQDSTLGLYSYSTNGVDWVDKLDDLDVQAKPDAPKVTSVQYISDGTLSVDLKVIDSVIYATSLVTIDGEENVAKFYIDGAFIEPATPPETNANPSPSQVFVDGEQVTVEAYLIDGSNYLKLRDLALALNGSEKQFNVAYDAVTKLVSLITGEAYVRNGTEGGKASYAKLGYAGGDPVSMDGAAVEIPAYKIDGSNYYKLREVMKLLDVGLVYDNETKDIRVDTSVGYTED